MSLLSLQSRRLDDKLINTWKIFENNDFSFPISRVTGRNGIFSRKVL